jgi:hypothetical protein
MWRAGRSASSSPGQRRSRPLRGADLGVRPELRRPKKSPPSGEGASEPAARLQRKPACPRISSAVPFYRKMSPNFQFRPLLSIHVPFYAPSSPFTAPCPLLSSSVPFDPSMSPNLQKSLQISFRGVGGVCARTKMTGEHRGAPNTVWRRSIAFCRESTRPGGAYRVTRRSQISPRFTPARPARRGGSLWRGEGTCICSN